MEWLKFNGKGVIMSWLYNHRHQFNGLYPLVEIAYWAVVTRVPPEDRDDVEQEIVISLMETIEKYGDKGKSYLKVVARNRVYEYLRRKYKEKRLCHIIESNMGEMAGGTWVFLHDGDSDARMDAIETLATLPKRLIQIGYKIDNGEKLSEADQHYWIRQKAKLRPKLNCRRYANRLSDWEKERILALHRKGVSMSRIARIMARSNKAVMRVLADSQPLSRRNWQSKMEMAAKERDELIRHAYLVEGQTIGRIVREFHHSQQTVRGALSPTERGRSSSEKGGAAGIV